jgi:hypothetical protein
MSHAVVIELGEVVVVGMASLVSLVAECGLEVLHERQLETIDGKTHQVDAVIAEGEVKVGIQLDAKAKVARFIPQDCDKGKGKALAQRVSQRWAYSRVVDELKRKGYQIGEEQKQKDGTIKLVATRWR